MSERVADRYQTEAARYLYRATLLDEEHRPLSGSPSPEALLERVQDEFNEAKDLVDDDEAACPEVDFVALALRLMWLGATALAAAAHVYEDELFAPTGFKDELLGVIDGIVAESIGRWDGDPLPVRELLADCEIELTDATEYVEACVNGNDDFADAATAFVNVANSAAIALAQVERHRTASWKPPAEDD
jgi:hypothetical protein